MFEVVTALKNQKHYPGKISNDEPGFRIVAEAPLIGMLGGEELPMSDVLYAFPDLINPNPVRITVPLIQLDSVSRFPSATGVMKDYMTALEQVGTSWKPT